MQYVILENLFQCRMTILGDYAQTLDTKQQDVLKFLPKIFGKGYTEGYPEQKLPQYL